MSLLQKIPENAELVFSGIRSKIYQWDQKMYDGTITRFEQIRFIDGAFVLPLLPDGRIILVKQEQPGRSEFIGLPGGSFDSPDENPRDCAHRELIEETGYNTDILVDWEIYYGTNNLHTNTYFFIARDCQLIGSIVPDGGEIIELIYVSFDEFLDLSSHPQFVHRSLTSLMYEARIYPAKKEALRKKIYG